jgi:hypothetical protein
VVVVSAFDKLGNKASAWTLYGLLDVSNINQFPIADDFFTITQRGRKLVNTNGPSVLPLPVYEPNAL